MIYEDQPITLEDRLLLEKIHQLRQEYEAAIKPYVDRLVQIRACQADRMCRVVLLEQLARQENQAAGVAIGWPRV